MFEAKLIGRALEDEGGSVSLTRDQAYMSLTFTLPSTLCLGAAILSHYMRRCLRERTSAAVLVRLVAAGDAGRLIAPSEGTPRGMTTNGRFLAVLHLRFDAANILPGGRCQRW